ncbi:MAG: phosphogluconate dehydrogenase (NAD(+)-dependent, decarboxylating) [Pirellulaceae bacterium]
MVSQQGLAFGIVGLGKIGHSLASQALDKGIHVVGFDIAGVSGELIRAGIDPAGSLQELCLRLDAPRIVFLYIPAGPVVDDVLQQLAPHLAPQDIVVDGGNSYWGDSIRRHERLGELGLQFVDVGTSGGIAGARHGACFMAGGEPQAIEHVEPILRSLAVEGGYVHAGSPGAGHFVKLVHNGIEFGMLQAIAEGVDLLEHAPFRLDLAEVLHCWRHGSVIRGWLIDLMEKTYRERDGLQAVEPYVEDTGEVDWLVHDAMHMEVPIPVIALAVMQLYASRDPGQNWARAIAMMRHGFGGHPYGRDESLAEERRVGRVGPYPR